jgi:uncharacterized protein YeeX (DUF496 family)
MNQLITSDKPTIKEQIEFVKLLRTKPLVIRTCEHTDMLREIEENLLACTRLTQYLEKGKEVKHG